MRQIRMVKGKTSVENERRLKLYAPTTAGWGQAPARVEPTRQPPRPGPRNSSPKTGRPEEEIQTTLPAPENLEVIPRENPPIPEVPAPHTEPTTALELDRDTGTATSPTEPTTALGPTDQTQEDSPSAEDCTESNRPRRIRRPRQFDDYVLYSAQTESKTNQRPIKAAPSEGSITCNCASGMLDLAPTAEEIAELNHRSQARRTGP